jgi:hypothetical protein
MIYTPLANTRMISIKNNATIGSASRTLFFVCRNENNGVVYFAIGNDGVSLQSFGFDYSSIGTSFHPYVWSGGIDRTSVKPSSNISLLYASFNNSTSSLTGYLNEPTDLKSTNTVLNTSNVPWYIGQRQNGNSSIDGQYMEFLHYNRILTQNEKE